MNIGIDISPLQGPHRMRGIGYTVLNFINNLPEKARTDHCFILFAYPDEHSAHGNVLELLDLTGIDHEVRYLKPRKRIDIKLPGRLKLINSVLNQLLALRDVYYGDSRITNLKGVDVFLQTDQSESLPKRGRTKKALILYDVIPYALEWEYLWSYKTARRVHGFSRKAALRVYSRRWLYSHKLRVNVRRATVLLSISEVTKSDFVHLLGTPGKKIVVTPLGVSQQKEMSTEPLLLQSIKTSWGYRNQPITFDPKTPFLLFVGGADKRRRLQDVVTAFNNLRAQGYDIKLVLAGDSMKHPDTIATEEVQAALKNSSYLEDIIFMGFIDDDSRDWLYRHALAFVFPSLYEGFGLPVLEAMVHKCPVISYRNDAVIEVAGNAPLYVKDALSLATSIKDLLGYSDKKLQDLRHKGLTQAQNYDWTKTAKEMMTVLTKSAV